jgi:hypothetical protein
LNRSCLPVSFVDLVLIVQLSAVVVRNEGDELEVVYVPPGFVLVKLSQSLPVLLETAHDRARSV